MYSSSLYIHKLSLICILNISICSQTFREDKLDSYGKFFILDASHRNNKVEEYYNIHMLFELL